MFILETKIYAKQQQYACMDEAIRKAQYTSVKCSDCGALVTKTLSTRTHKCKCGCVLDRNDNVAKNILSIGLSTVGHKETKAWGDETSILEGASYEVSS